MVRIFPDLRRRSGAAWRLLKGCRTRLREAVAARSRSDIHLQTEREKYHETSSDLVGSGECRGRNTPCAALEGRHVHRRADFTELERYERDAKRAHRESAGERPTQRPQI